MPPVKVLLKKFGRYCAIGVTAFALDYALMVLLAELIGIDPLVAATASFCIATAFNYLAFMWLVFSRRADLGRRSEFLAFFLVTVVGLALNNLFLWAGIEYLAIDYRIMKLGSGATVGIMSSFARRALLDADRRRRETLRLSCPKPHRPLPFPTHEE